MAHLVLLSAHESDAGLRLEVTGAGNGVSANGIYQIEKHCRRKGRHCFSKVGGGAIYFDGSFWKICQTGNGPNERGWNFSQKPKDSGPLPPLGRWFSEKRIPSEQSSDYSELEVNLVIVQPNVDRETLGPWCMKAVNEGLLLLELRQAGGGPVLDSFRDAAEALFSKELRLSASHTMRNAGADPLGFHYSQSENATGRAGPTAKQDAAFDAERAGPEALFQAMKDLVQRETALLFLAMSDRTAGRPGDDAERGVKIEASEQLDALWISSQRALACDLGADVSKTELTNIYTHLIETQPRALEILLGRAAHDLAMGHAAGGKQAAPNAPKCNGAGRPVRLGSSASKTLAGLEGSRLFYCGCKFAEPGEHKWSPSGMCAEGGGGSDSVSVPCAACVQLLVDTGRIQFGDSFASSGKLCPMFLLSDLVVALGIKSLSKENEALAVQLSFALFASCVQVEHVGQHQAEWAATQLSRLVHSHKDALLSPVWAPFKAAAKELLPRLLTAVEAGESKVVPSKALMHSLFLQSLIEVAVLTDVPWLEADGATRLVMKVFERLAQPALRLTVEMRTKLLELAAQSTKAEISAAPTGDRLQVGEGALQKVAPGPGSAPKLSTPYDPLPDGFEALAHLPADELHRCVEDVKVISTALASGAYAQLSLCTTGSLCHEMLLRRKHELLLPETTKKVLETVIRRTNDGGSDDHGPEIELNRMSHVVASQETKRTLFAQACTQLLPRIQGENPDRLRRIRAWKVLFVGEGASHEVIAAHCTAACIRLPLFRARQSAWSVRRCERCWWTLP